MGIASEVDLKKQQMILYLIVRIFAGPHGIMDGVWAEERRYGVEYGVFVIDGIEGGVWSEPLRFIDEKGISV